MDQHRRLYKAAGRNLSPKNRVKKAIAIKRLQNRDNLMSQHRSGQLLVEDDNPISEPETSTLSLTKQQRHYLKFIAWRMEKEEKKPKFVVRPFTATVPKNTFLGPQLSVVPANHAFRPPANLPQLTLRIMSQTIEKVKDKPLNDFIVTRSMAAKAKLEAEQCGLRQNIPNRTVPKRPTSSKFTITDVRPASERKPPSAASSLPKKSVDKPIAKFVAPKVPPKRPVAVPRPAAVLRPAAVPRPAKIETAKVQKLPAVSSKATTTKAAHIVPLQSNANTLHIPTGDVNITDVTAVNSNFVIDGSMITSTAHKDYKRASAHDHNVSADLFSPIEADEPVETDVPLDLNTTPTRTTESPSNINYVSPFVSTTRGKVSARKERKQRESVYKLDLNRLPDDEPAVVDDVNVRRRREASLYFRKQVDDETNRLQGLIDKWQRYKDEFSKQMLSEYVDLIDVTTGQTRLLLGKKFGNFRDIISRYEAGGGEQVDNDLEGLWSLVYKQVEQCNARFERLDILKASEWKDADADDKVEMPKKKTIQNAKGGILGVLKNSRAKLQRELLAKKTAGQRTADTPKKTLANTPGQGTTKPKISALTPRHQMTPQRQSNATPKYRSAKRSILKTPGTDRKSGRGVAFVSAVQDENVMPARGSADTY